MARVQLTDQLVAAHQYAGGTDYLWDAVRRGFGLRTYPSGRKSWVVQLAGGAKVVGDWPTFTLEEAWLAGRRKQQAEALAAFGLPQADPPLAPVGTQTLEDLAREHVGWMRAKRKASAAADVDRRYRLVILPELGGARPLASFTAGELELWHQRQPHRRVVANRAMETLRAGFGHAERWGWVPPLFNPLRHFGRWKFDERPRERVLSRAEAVLVRRRLEELAASPGPHQRPALGLLLILITGLRHQEAAKLELSALRLDAGALVLEDHKTSRKHGAKAVAVPDEGIALLRRAVELMGPGEQRLFRVGHFYRTWAKVRPANDVTPHDVRRTLATRLDEDGEALHRIARQLGQRDVRVTRDVYTHPSMQSLRAVANRGAGLMH